MAKTIWKFPLKGPHDYNEIEMPKGAEILTAQVQNKTICLWAMVDPEAPKETRMIEIAGTGTTIIDPDGPRKYIATVQVGPYVFHLFEYWLTPAA
jgi:hypothetical protein